MILLVAWQDLADPSEQVDAFVSHAWADNHEQRHAALARWAEKFELVHGRKPVIWLDKALFDHSLIHRNPLSGACAALGVSMAPCASAHVHQRAPPPLLQLSEMIRTHRHALIKATSKPRSSVSHHSSWVALSW